MADLAAYSTDHLRPHLAGLHPLLAATLNSPSLDVQVAAATVCCAFINSLEDAREREVFQPLLLPILASLVRVGEGGGCQ
jgi:hypothetical protein